MQIGTQMGSMNNGCFNGCGAIISITYALVSHCSLYCDCHYLKSWW